MGKFLALTDAFIVVFTLAYPARVSRLVLLGAPAGVQRPNVPLQLRLLGLPVVGQFLGRRLMSNPTREGSHQFWGDILVRHPERVDDALVDADGERATESRQSFEPCAAACRCRRAAP